MPTPVAALRSETPISGWQPQYSWGIASLCPNHPSRALHQLSDRQSTPAFPRSRPRTQITPPTKYTTVAAIK
jgi:hypothetical protein